MTGLEQTAPEKEKQPVEMPDDEVLYELADLFRVFGDSTRIKILYALHDSELCVQDIADAVQLSQSAVSHQLRVLKDSKLVRFRQDQPDTPSKKPPVYTMPKIQAAISTSTGAIRSMTWPFVSLPSSTSSP